VRYSTRTRAGLLRQPSWHRLRPDLAPEDSAADLP
jgi:bifunctional non-homologous end joining protein LigD